MNLSVIRVRDWRSSRSSNSNLCRAVIDPTLPPTDTLHAFLVVGVSAERANCSVQSGMGNASLRHIFISRVQVKEKILADKMAPFVYTEASLSPIIRNPEVTKRREKPSDSC